MHCERLTAPIETATTPFSTYPPQINTSAMETLECPICLEGIKPPDIIGIVQPCSHHYHEQCLLQWSTQSNSCPTCRKPFHKVNIAVKSNPEAILRSFSVQDRLMPNDAINNIPTEFVIPPNLIPQREPVEQDRDIQPAGVCQICSSASYALRQRAMASCVACNSSFHVSCLGAASHEPGSTEWFCPNCDCYQELYSSGPSRSRTRRPARAIPRSNTLITTDSDLAQAVFEESLDSLGTGPSLQRARSHVLNGGVLLRREERALRNLTPEEAHLWDMFEQARTGGLGTAPTTPVEEKPRRKRRRRGEAAAEPLFAQSPPEPTQSPSEAGSSRISSLMSQIRLRPRSLVTDERSAVQIPSAALTMTRMSPLISPVTSDSESELRRPPIERPGRELTLEQKRIIQKHVRDNLRPLYTPNDPTKTGTITTEDEYIRINKSISRKIYSAILSLGEEEGPQIYEDYFDNPSSKLRDLVDCCVQRELAGIRYG